VVVPALAKFAEVPWSLRLVLNTTGIRGAHTATDNKSSYINYFITKIL